MGSIASEAGVAHANTLHPYGQQEELERASRVAANKMYELSAVVLRMIGDVALGAAVAHSLSDDGEQNGRALDDMAYEASGIAQEIRTAIELIRGDIVPSGMETQRETAEEVTRLRGLLGF